MLIPYRIEGGVERFPLGTVLLIAANVAVFLARSIADVEPTSGMLVFGELDPWQWLTSLFIHAGWMHLIGNMLFLWVFGLIVEDRCGWAVFLPLYLVIGLAEGALTQLSQTEAISGPSGPMGALGASGAIMGIMAVALVWAPRDRVRCWFWFVRIMPTQMSISVIGLALFLLAYDTLMWAVAGFVVSGALSHLLGAGLGFVLGMVLRRTRFVNTDDRDLFSKHRRGL